MKPNISLLLACGIAFGVERLDAGESIPRTAEPIVVDGALDEPVWRVATPVEVDYLGSKQGVKSAEKRMAAKYAWDGDSLCIAYETFDSNLLAQGNGRTEGPAENLRPGASIYDPATKLDVVEFFISFGDEHFMWEIHHNALNQFNDVFCIVPAPEWPVAKGTLASHGIIFNDGEWLRDHPPHTVAHAVKLKPKADGQPSTVNAPGDVDTGYTAEIRIPWRSLGVPKTAETWREEQGKRVRGPWNVAGLEVSLLAVVQDGDLPERYHHSGPKRKSDWFHKTQPDWPVYRCAAAAAPGDAGDTSNTAAAAAVAAILADREAGGVSSEAVESLIASGVAAAVAAAGFLDETRPAQAEVLADIIARAAKCRRMHPELLRLYDPAAFELFHSPAAAAAQEPLAAGLTWKAWPRSLPEAVVHAAPLPTLGWLKAQAASPNPDLAKLRLMFPSLGWWLRAESERQYAEDFHGAVASCARNPAVVRDPRTADALLKLVADARVVAAADWVIGMLESPDEDLRQAAATALGRIAYRDKPDRPALSDEGRSKALAELLGRIRSEPSPPVLAKLAEAAEAWPQSAEVGQAIGELFRRSTDAEVRRSILLAVANTQWPERHALIREALEKATGGVLGAALEAAAVHPDASLLRSIGELLAERPDASPQLIDAAGAVGDPAAIGSLLGWLKKEKNPAVRMKMILAINHIPGEVPDRVLTDLLANVAEPLEADLLCRIAGQRNLPPGATRFLSGLAEDVTAPVAIRGQAIWALGHYADADARDSLRRLSADTPKYFPDLAAGRLIPEQLEQARLFIDLARLRQGDKAAEAEVARRYQAATPATQVAVLRSLSQIQLDSPLIAAGLKSGDFAVLEAAVRAARAADRAKYAADLAAIRRSPFIIVLLDSGLDTWQLQTVLAEAADARTTTTIAP
jgi:hypothetical protein